MRATTDERFCVLTTLFLLPMDFVKNLIRSEAAIEKCSTKWELPPSKSFKVASFKPLDTAAMWTILDAAVFLNVPLVFTYRKNDGYFEFNAISLYKVYIDF